MKIKTKSCSIALALSLFILFLISSTVSTASAAPENLTVYFIDVGQGDSILLEYGDNEMLIDAGEIGKGDDVENYVKSKGVTSLDYVVATHPHSDHIGGMPVILQDFPVSHFLDSGYPQTTEIYETMLGTIDSKNIPFATLKRGDKIDFASGIDVEVLNPGSTYFKDDLNQNSIVLKVTDEKVSFLLMGDAGIEAENAIMSAGYDVNANILKVGHHGNNTASGASFISAVSPEVSVIEVGAGNQYGHPHAETLNTLQNAGTTVYRTDYNGSVTITTDGSTYTVTKEKPAGSNQQVPVFPVADFNVNTTSGYAPLDVQFTDVSQNAISRSWYFGDGITSTDQNPKHTYSAAGTYTANLTVRNANGTNSKTSEITVSNLNMPTTIKVLRTATGQIETVDFDYYVKNVMPNEWGMPGWPTETLKAGAMAVKMYGWVHVAAYHKYPGLGYDVKDTTADQVYIPGSEQLYTNAAVNAIWDYTMTRDGQLFEPEYDSGVVGSLKPIYPNRLSQQGAVILANQGKTWDQILHYYYDPRGVISIQR